MRSFLNTPSARPHAFRRCVASMLFLLFVVAVAMPGVAGAQTDPAAAQSQAATAGQNTVSASGAPQISLRCGVAMEGVF